MRSIPFVYGILLTFTIVLVWSSQSEGAVPKFDRSQNATEGCPELVDWDSIAPKQCFYVIFPAEYVVVHHTMGHRCLNAQICKQIVKNIQVYSMNVKSFPDIMYNFLIGEDLNVYQGTGWFRKGFSSSYEKDPKSISVAFIGDFSDDLPYYSALEKLRMLIECGVKHGYIAKQYQLIAASQENDQTTSPGTYIYNHLKTYDSFRNDENEAV